jgi:hypothetical protein
MELRKACLLSVSNNAFLAFPPPENRQLNNGWQ